MEQYLIDNNIISHYLAGTYSSNCLEFISKVFDAIPNISVITEIEALSWVHIDKVKEAIIKELVSDSNVISINSKIVEICVAIRRSKRIKTPDAIIAATALAFDLTLISSDNIFESIKELKLINPVKL